MPSFSPNRNAHQGDSGLKQSLVELRRAEKNAFLWFAEVLERTLYRDLGFSSIHQYAELELGFSRSRIYQFVRLAGSLRDLPRLRESVARGEMPWTKAWEVAKAATAMTERVWIREARTTSRRKLLDPPTSRGARWCTEPGVAAGDPENLTTLCSGCHRLAHEQAGCRSSEPAWNRVPLSASGG